MNAKILNFQSPASQLVVKTAQKNWWLIVINLCTNLLSAALEGGTLGVIYLAVSYLTISSGDLNTDAATDSTIIQTLSSFFPLPPDQMFLLLIGGALLLQILLSLSSYANKVATAYFSAKAQPYATGQVFKQIMKFSCGCLSRYKVGDLVMFTNDAALAVNIQITEINNLVLGVSFSVIYLIIIVRLSAVLAIAAAVLTLLVAFIQYKLIPRLRQVVKQVTATQVESAKYITESIQALRLVHTFGTQRKTVTVGNALLAETQKQLQKRAFIFYLPEPFLETVPMIALSILAASAVLFQSNQATILPMLLTFVLALQRLSIRLRATVSTVTRLVDNSARMMRLESILEEHNKVLEQSGTESFRALSSDIKFDSVSLSYTNDDSYALKDLSFTIPCNQVTALVGESGGGKSSIVDLLIGLYQPTAGRLLVNNRSLSEYCLEEWRQRIGVVSQDAFVFNASILDNLRYGCPEASKEEAIAAAQAAQAHQFISAFPNGYETVVGERGYRLSGGQRQRLALARALVKQPEILILDEATSALDSESEKLIQRALKQFQRNRTVIVIAHRLSTVTDADQILVLQHGKIVEQGTHSSLLSEGQRYAGYWHLQSDPVAV